MVTIFNRKKLVTDSSSQEIARVRGVLEENGIDFYTETKRNANIVLEGNYARMAASRGMAYSSMRGPVDYTYTIWVKKKDYDRAEKLL